MKTILIKTEAGTLEVKASGLEDTVAIVGEESAILSLVREYTGLEGTEDGPTTLLVSSEQAAQIVGHITMATAATPVA